MKHYLTKLSAALAVSVSLSAPAIAEKIDDTFTYMGLNSGHHGSLVVGVKAMNYQGRVAVCGIAWVEPFENGGYSSSVMSDLREITRKISYSLAEKSLRFSTVKFAYVQGVDAARETEVPCIATRVAWTEAMTGERIEMTARRITIRK